MADLHPKNLTRSPKFLFVAAVLVASCWLCTVEAAEQTNTEAKPISYNGVTVSPAIQKLSLNPGQPSAAFNVVVTNNTVEPVDLILSSVDFKSLNESGGLAFIDSNASSVSHKHGLASWLNLGTPSIHLDSRQSQLVTMSVENRDDLSPGGHYAAVLFKTDKPNTNSGETHVAINQVVSMLVFVQKLGGEKFGVSMKPLGFRAHWFNLPSTLNLSFKNTGNIQATPSGLVTISDPVGNEVSRGQVNPDSSLILPDSQRVFKTTLVKTGNAWLPGIYTARTIYQTVGGTSSGVSQSKFLFVNLKATAIASTIILLCGIVVWKATILLRSRRRNKKA